MSACKLGTVPVNRLTREQFDFLIRRCSCIFIVSYTKLLKTNNQLHHLTINKAAKLGQRIQQYRDNLTTRGL